jgi:prepilin-type N-terminal cleavage/methylation domain-containing protein
MLNLKSSKGFTLIELLVVIAIIAVLSVVVVLTLNPAELLKQARDSTRVSDLSTLKTALGTYFADVSSPTSTQGGAVTQCYLANSVTSTAGANCGFSTTFTNTTSTLATAQAVNGTGWLPIPFTSISSGAPIGNLPVDPTNSTTFVYRYAPSSTLVYEIDADLESTKQTASTGAEGTDGGNSATLYEVGNAPGLAL